MDLATVIEQTGDFETRHAARREKTILARTPAECLERFAKLMGGWTIESVNKQPDRIVVRLVQFTFS